MEDSREPQASVALLRAGPRPALHDAEVGAAPAGGELTLLALPDLRRACNRERPRLRRREPREASPKLRPPAQRVDLQIAGAAEQLSRRRGGCAEGG